MFKTYFCATLLLMQHTKILFDDFKSVFSIGGTEVADALIEHKNGFIILAEVKSAPLIIFPLLFQVPQTSKISHTKISLTNSQFNDDKIESDSDTN